MVARPSPNKDELRRWAREHHAKVPTAQVERWDQELREHLLHWLDEEPCPADMWIGLFGGLPGEPDLVDLLFQPLLQRGVRCSLMAYAEGGKMEPVAVNKIGDLGTSEHGAWRPRLPTPLLTPDQLGILMVPALLFDPHQGTRLGRGGGYFDRFLPRCPASVRVVGVGYEHSLYNPLPHEPHDQIVPLVITEKRVLQPAAQYIYS